jgi:predicted membrane metal-binding protein
MSILSVALSLLGSLGLSASGSRWSMDSDSYFIFKLSVRGSVMIHAVCFSSPYWVA